MERQKQFIENYKNVWKYPWILKFNEKFYNILQYLMSGGVNDSKTGTQFMIRYFLFTICRNSSMHGAKHISMVDRHALEM